MLEKPYGRAKAILKEPLTRCCPTCLRPMREKDGVWLCPKHGAEKK